MKLYYQGHVFVRSAHRHARTGIEPELIAVNLMEKAPDGGDFRAQPKGYVPILRPTTARASANAA